MGLAKLRERQKLKLHHILRLFIGALIAIATIGILRHTIVDGMKFLDTHNIIHYYHVPDDEANSLIIDFGAVFSAVTVVYLGFFALFLPISYLFGVPRYFMIFFFLSIFFLLAWSDAYFPS